VDTEAVRFLQQENARLQEEGRALREENQSLRRYLDAVRELYWLAQHVDSAANPLDLLDQLLRQIIEGIGAEDGSISYLDEIAGELVFVLVHGGLRQALRGYRIKSDAGIAGWVVSHHEPIIVNQPRQDWRFSREVDQEFNFFTRSIVCVPMIIQDKLVGVIELLNKRGGEFTDTDTTILSMLSPVAAKVLATTPLPS
jgi:GAF domain-containing protein